MLPARSFAILYRQWGNIYLRVSVGNVNVAIMFCKITPDWR
jgi:hypothetical protein